MRNFHFKDEPIEKKILVVEDDEISFLVLSEYIKQLNYKIVRATNGKEAVSIIQKHKGEFSLVLMDIVMPVMNGFEAAKKIKQFDKTIPIVAQTAVDYTRSIDANFSNFDNVLLKPLDFNKLKKLVRSSFRKKKISWITEFQIN